MKVVRENSALESWKAMLAIQAEGAKREQDKIRKAIQEANNMRNTIHNTIDTRIENQKAHGRLLESCKNNELSKVLKAIYITALEANSLTDNAIILAENMVDSWINEMGGASSIFNKNANKTYLLSRIQQIVEDAADEDVKDIEKDESEVEDKDTEPSDDRKEKSSQDNNEDDPLDVTFDDDEDSSDDGSEDDSDTDDYSDDEKDDDSLTSDGESHGKVFDELEKEEDVKKAIELIRKRVADAEETFIKRNAEDKKQIDELLSKISDNIKTVENMDDEDSEQSKVAQERACMMKRKINNITENRPLTIFEKMTRILSPNIIKNEVLKEQYSDENGRVDFGSIVESSKVMYGFLETLNTLQLEKVDENYITKVLNEM